MVSFTCSTCNEAVQIPETSIGQTIECPECGSYIETSSRGVVGESDASIPPRTDEDPYREETEEYEESAGVDRRIIVGIAAVAAVVVVGLIILAVVIPAVLRSSGSRPAARSEDLRGQQQVADTDSRPQPVTSDTQPEEPVEAVQLPKPGDVVGNAVTNSIGMKLVYIPPGSFMMGSSDSAAQLAREYDTKEAYFKHEFPQHEVRISDGFWMSQTEVTQGQYNSVMNAQPWSGKPGVQEDANNPAAYVSWDDAVEFCRKLSQQEGKTYRLPTEAEWEYACRAGTTTPFSFGDSYSSLGDYAWFDGNAHDVDEKYAHSVGQKKPNPWGMYDMHGNVWEWCNDWYADDYYSESPRNDPTGPDTGSYRVIRGGGWSLTPQCCRSAYRNGRTPSHRCPHLGFRVSHELTDPVNQLERLIGQRELKEANQVDRMERSTTMRCLSHLFLIMSAALLTAAGGNDKDTKTTPASTDVVATLKGLGAHLVELDGDGEVVTVRLNFVKTLTDADLKHLTGLRKLRGLKLGRTNITDTGLAHLRELTSLEFITLVDTQVTDAGLMHLKGLTNLRSLWLGGTRVTDTGMEQLKGMTKLIALTLGGTQITDAGVEHLKALPNLEQLSLGGTQVTDVGLEHLKSFSNLKGLSLD
ncbi:MAG: SUMF1/EgtB/PvdO family nonheme iron enzyme, partial [Planctomycetota bacterium]